MAAHFRIAIIIAGSLLTASDYLPRSWYATYRVAVQWFNHAEFEHSRAEAESGCRKWCQKSTSSACIRFRLLLAESLIELARSKDALPLLDVAVAAPEDEARRLADLAMAQFRTGNDGVAWQNIEKADRIAPPEASEVRGKIDLIRGMSQLKSGQTTDAERSLTQALGAVSGSQSLIECYALSDLGFLDLQRSRFDEAQYWFGRAEGLARQNRMQRALELALLNLGATLMNLGDYERAIRDLNQAETLAEALRDRFYQIDVLVLLGETWYRSGDLAKAAECYEKARAIGNPEVDKEWLSNVLDDLSMLALRRGDPVSAAHLNIESVALSKKLGMRDLILSHRIQSAAVAAAAGNSSEAEGIYRESLAAGQTLNDPIALFQCHAGLASLYRNTKNLAKAVAEYRAAAEVIDEEHARLQQDESKLSLRSSLVDFYRDYVDFLIDQNDPAGAFRVAESSRARVLAEKLHREGENDPAADLKSLEQEARDSGTILLSYWVAPRRSLLWVFDSAGLHSILLPSEEEITAQVRRYNDAIQRGDNPAATGNDAGRWLFWNLLAAHYRISKGSRVVIEPDGALHQLNFESLPVEVGGRYWIEDATVSVAPSLALLRRSPYSQPRKLLLFGDPGYDGLEFQRLPNVKTELEAVEKHFPEKQVFVASAATPAAYREVHPDAYSAVHFAAHAVANRESPLDSAIVLSGPPENRKLYAREILQQPLTAELVTLSACQTAGSRTYYGEGLTGFSWAFLSAGAHNVVAGLWDVDDRATAILMRNFYDGLSSGQPPVDALRSAKLGLAGLGGINRKPRYWAAFEIFTKALYR